MDSLLSIDQQHSVEESRGLSRELSSTLHDGTISHSENQYEQNRLFPENDFLNNCRQREYSRPAYTDHMVPASNLSAPLPQRDINFFNSNPPRTLFLRDLPFHFRDEDLRQWIENIVDGNAYEVELCRVKYSLKLKKTLQVGFVMLRTPELAKRVLERIRASPRCVGRDLRVQMFEAVAECEKSFAGSVQFRFDAEFTEPLLTEEMAREHFESAFGDILTICIRAHYDKNLKQSGFGFVSFLDSKKDEELKQGSMLQWHKIIYRFNAATQKQPYYAAESYNGRSTDPNGQNKHQNLPREQLSRRNYCHYNVGEDAPRAQQNCEEYDTNFQSESSYEVGNIYQMRQHERSRRYYAEGEYSSEVMNARSHYTDTDRHSVPLEYEHDSMMRSHESVRRQFPPDLNISEMSVMMSSAKPVYSLVMVPVMDGSYPFDVNPFARQPISPVATMGYIENHNIIPMSRIRPSYRGPVDSSNMMMSHMATMPNLLRSSITNAPPFFVLL